MSLEKIVAEAMAGRPLEMKEAFAEEIQNRVQDRLEEKYIEMTESKDEDDDEDEDEDDEDEDEDDDEDEDEDDLDEAAGATVDSGRAQHALDSSGEKRAHSNYMKKTHGVDTKYHGSDELSYHGPKANVKKALINHYDDEEDDAKDEHPHVFKESFDVDSLLALFEKLEESQIDLILANLDEHQLDEISNKTIDSYRKKAYGQYKTSADKQSDGPWGSEKPETRAKHAARYAKRHKGIGSADKRTMARDPDNLKFGRIGQDGHDPKKDSMSSKTVGDMRKIKGYSNKKESVVYEAMSNNVLDRLRSGEGASHHMGHEGAAQQHHGAAEDARADGNTKAAEHHERASAHHERASEHLEAGNHIMADHNSDRAAHHAKLAVKHGGEETDSHEVHQDHSKAYRLHSAGDTAESFVESLNDAQAMKDRAAKAKARLSKPKEAKFDFNKR